MKMQSFLDRPAKRAVYAFMGLMVVAVALAIATKTGVIDSVFEARLQGVLIGVMVIVMGNLLPKLRPLNAHGGEPAAVTAAERLAGWLLVLAGIAQTAFFLFAPLEQARPISSLIGIGAIVIVAVSWTRLAILALKRRDTRSSGHVPAKRAAEQRQVVAWLMFAFFYVFATACLTFLFKDQRWFHTFMSWMLIGAVFLYALLYTILGHAPRRCRKP